MPEYDFDLLVIGGGPGGYVAAIRGAQLGLRTACVESRETLGGTCLNVGCIPSKALLHASEQFERARSGELAKFGIRIAGATLDLAQMHAEKAKAVHELTGGIAGLFRKNEVTWLKGMASFVTADTVEIDGKAVRAKNIVVATGSRVSAPPGVEIDDEIVIDSAGALKLSQVPARLVVIGGGVIGLELGSVWRRLGAEVVVVEYLDLPLAGMDDEIRRTAAEIFKKQGLTLRLSSKVTAVERTATGATVTIEPAAGGPAEKIDADVVLAAVGRRPNTAGLALEKAGIIVNKLGQIEVDGKLRSAIPGIWAIGDVTPGPMLAHRAEDDGVAVAENIAGRVGLVNHEVIPSVVYTHPEIASVGLTEEEAKAQGEVKIGKFPFLANSRAKTNRDTDGFVKVIADAKTDRVLGVHIISSVAGTMIAQAAQAMEFAATSEDIAYTCHAHPTHSEALKEAAMAVKGKAIHF